MEGSIQVGAVVLSKMGRDTGRYYVVVKRVGEEFALLCDGDKRKLIKPKLKKLKHLKYKGDNLDTVKDKILNGSEVTDAEIRRALKAYNTKNSEV